MNLTTIEIFFKIETNPDGKSYVCFWCCLSENWITIAATLDCLVYNPSFAFLLVDIRAKVNYYDGQGVFPSTDSTLPYVCTWYTYRAHVVLMITHAHTHTHRSTLKHTNMHRSVCKSVLHRSYLLPHRIFHSARSFSFSLSHLFS